VDEAIGKIESGILNNTDSEAEHTDDEDTRVFLLFNSRFMNMTEMKRNWI
jgi:hypothetical protein